MRGLLVAGALAVVLASAGCFDSCNWTPEYSSSWDSAALGTWLVANAAAEAHRPAHVDANGDPFPLPPLSESGWMSLTRTQGIAISVGGAGMNVLAGADMDLAVMRRAVDRALNETYDGAEDARNRAVDYFFAEWTEDVATLDNPSHYVTSGLIELPGPWTYASIWAQEPRTWVSDRVGYAKAAGHWTFRASLATWDLVLANTTMTADVLGHVEVRRHTEPSWEAFQANVAEGLRAIGAPVAFDNYVQHKNHCGIA